MTTATVVKPPYELPPRGVVATTELSAVSTFSGCGGGSLGLRWAGFGVLYANEFVPEAAETYRQNFPKTYLDERDVREITGAEIREAIGFDAFDVETIGRRGKRRIPAVEIDLLEGSPPCADFSLVGKREAGWGEERSYSDTRQRTDDLFGEFVRLVGELRPRTFVAENVPGLAMGKAKGHYLRILEELAALGYDVAARVLDAAWLGVPQRRRRIVFVGVRDDLAFEPPFPSPLPYQRVLDEALDGVENSEDDLDGTSLKGYAIGEEWKRLSPGEMSRRYFQLKRADRRYPCPTVTQAGGRISTAAVTHPDEPRKFTIPELRRVCGFPDDFVLTGTYAQQWERLGRAVPPPVYLAVGRVLADALRRHDARSRS